MNFSKLLYLTVVLLTITVAATQKYQNNVTFASDNVWVHLGRISGLFLRNCWPWSSYQQQDILPPLQNCLKEKTLTALVKTFQGDRVEILDGVEFVKIKSEKENSSRKMDNSLEESDWEGRLMDTIADIFETHMLKIHLESFLTQDVAVNEVRHRRHRRGNMIMPLMMFGVLAMGMLLIPMGFKFLTILGAKALLLAKMALILTSIQGLKKVATSGFNYGLYHSPPVNPWHYDRHGVEAIPNEQLEYLHHQHLRS